jgi:hypothetical protein
VPDKWNGNLTSTESQFDYFNDFAPLFVTTEIPFEEFGDVMQNHVHQFNLGTHPRKLLISGLKAKRVLLATPLLK